MAEVNAGDVQILFNSKTEYSVSVARLVKTVMNISFLYAVNHKFIAVNPTKGINLPKKVVKKSYHIRTIDTQKTLTSEQIMVLIEASKGTPIHMQVLFNVLMGHAKEIITIDVYGDNQGIIADCVPEISDFMEEVMPGPETDDKFKEELLDIVIDTREYLDEVS